MKTENKPENPSAFPYYESNHHAGQIILGDKGITLRDYFANSAMQGLCVYGLSNGLMTHQITEMAYKIADAMLKAREL